MNMKRSIVFVLVVALGVGFLTGTYQTVSGYGDDISITVHPGYGDPSWVEGIRTELVTECDNHMLWNIVHTAGDPGTTQTSFTFSQENVNEYSWTNRDEFNFHISGGFGVSTSGGSLDVGKDGWGKVVRDLAKDVKNGESLEKEILLEDYMDYYPMDYYVTIQTSMYWIDEYHDSLGSVTAESGSYGRWTQNFKYPVIPGSMGQVSVTKGEDGGIVQMHVSVYDMGNSGFITSVWEEGMYFAPVFTDYSGVPQVNGEYVMGYGLYHIPFKKDPGVEFHSDTTKYAGLFDHDNLELIYPLDPEDLVVAMEADERGILHLIVREEGVYRYCALDIEKSEILHKIDIMEAEEDIWCHYKFFLDQGLIYLQYSGKIALVAVGDEPSVEFVVEMPEGVSLALPESIRYREGILYSAALDWLDLDGDAYFDRLYYLAAMDREGVRYVGYYQPTREGKGHTYAYISDNQIRILD